MNYLRAYIPNSMVFLTIVTANRRNILVKNISILKTALKKSIENYNYKIYAICILPDHIHMIIKPYQIKDYPMIIKQFKTYFSKRINTETLENYNLSSSNKSKKERDIWQRRYWEHTIKDINDLNKHTDYIHYNPLKHNLVKLPKDWEYSSFKKFVKLGFYDNNWCNYKDKNNIINLNFE